MDKKQYDNYVKILRSELIVDEGGSNNRGFWNTLKNFFKVKHHEEDESHEKTV